MHKGKSSVENQAVEQHDLPIPEEKDKKELQTPANPHKVLISLY